jgi:uncharacterized protein involved in type VI secretion and phage assembly
MASAAQGSEEVYCNAHGDVRLKFHWPFVAPNKLSATFAA